MIEKNHRIVRPKIKCVAGATNLVNAIDSHMTV